MVYCVDQWSMKDHKFDWSLKIVLSGGIAKNIGYINHSQIFEDGIMDF